MTLLSIANVLTAEEVSAVLAELDDATWKDGRATAGPTAKLVKDNLQADLSSVAGEALRERLRAAVLKHPVIKAAAWPRRTSKVMVSKTTNGGSYGPHVDNAFMGRGPSRLRTDLSFTLFLSEPSSYEGGELVIHSASGTQEIKLEAGDLCLYATSEIHEVQPVTSGERIVAVGWIESAVASPAQRSLLFDLENLRASLRAKLSPGAPELLSLDKSIANLLRMWGQP